MRTKFYIVILLSVIAATAIGQIVVRDINTSKFPDVSLVVQTGNPDSTTVIINEDGHRVDLIKVDTISPEPRAESQNVLFLWDYAAGSIVPEMIADLFNGMTLKPIGVDSIRVNVASYYCDNNGQSMLNMLSPKFVTDMSVAQKMVFDEAEKGTTYQTGNSTDFLKAIQQAVAVMNALPPTEAKSLVLVTGGRDNFDAAADVMQLVKAARKNHVAMYAVCLGATGSSRSFCETIARETYGQCLLVDSPAGALQRADAARMAREAQNGSGAGIVYTFEENNVVGQWLVSMARRWEGMAYSVTFRSRFERTGEQKQLTVMVGDDVFNTTYKLPGVTIGSFIVAHPILSTILFVLLTALLVTGGYYYMRRRSRLKALQKQEEARVEQERLQLKSEQETLRRRVEIAEREHRRVQTAQQSSEQETARLERTRAMNQFMASHNIKARILIFNKSGSTNHVIEKCETLIGSSAECDITITDPTVSRRHAVIYYDGKVFGIRDMGSTNGIVMNGVRVKDLKLRSGDIVSMGGTTIKFYF